MPFSTYKKESVNCLMVYSRHRTCDTEREESSAKVHNTRRCTMRTSYVAIAIGFGLLLGALLLYFTIGLIEQPTSSSEEIPGTEVEKYTHYSTKLQPTRGYHEQRAVYAAISSMSKWNATNQENNSAITARNILCATFIELSNSTIDLYIQNMKHIGNNCHWTYIVYKYNTADKEILYNDFIKRVQPLQLSFEIVFAPPRRDALTSIHAICQVYANNVEFKEYQLEEICRHIKASSPAELPDLPYNHRIYPKVLLFLHLLPKLDAYRYVWILDGDMSLQGFNLQRYLHVLHCSFDRAPRISQPLINENTQAYSYLNKASWDGSALQDVLAAQTGFIEVQVPFIETALFQWYLLSFVLPMVVPAHILGADWGFDTLFCNAAKLFHVLATTTLHQHRHSVGIFRVADASHLDARLSDQDKHVQNMLRFKQYFLTAASDEINSDLFGAVTVGSGGSSSASARGGDLIGVAVGDKGSVGTRVAAPLGGVRGRVLSPSSSAATVAAGTSDPKRLKKEGQCKLCAMMLRAVLNTSTLPATGGSSSSSVGVGAGTGRGRVQGRIDPGHPVCAVIPGGAPLSHVDSRQTNRALGLQAKKLLNWKMMQLVQHSFPSFYLMGQDPGTNPLNPESGLKMVRELKPGC
jgi:hypothetical protein